MVMKQSAPANAGSKITFPVVFVNFKVYRESSGKNAVLLAKQCEMISKKTGVCVVPVVSAVDVRAVSLSVSLPVFAQHADPVSFGKGNGKIVCEALREAGAAGVVVNHAEDPVSDEIASRVISRAHEAGLQVLACAEDDTRAHALARFSPELLAVEPPELIGGNISVSTANPKLVLDSVAAVASVNPQIAPLMGAGVKSFEDAAASVKLGAKGLFVASGVILAADPAAALGDLCNGLRSQTVLK